MPPPKRQGCCRNRASGAASNLRLRHCRSGQMRAAFLRRVETVMAGVAPVRARMSGLPGSR